MRSISTAQRRARLARRHFLAADSTAGSLTELTAALIGLHATDPATPYLSAWARTANFRRASLDHELYENRSLIKHLAMRRTLWLIRTSDLPKIQAGASDRVADNEHRRLVADVEKAGVARNGVEWVDAACAAVERYLAEHGPTSASELRKALPELAGTYDAAPGKPWGGEGPLSPRVLTVLGVRGAIVRGPNDGTWTTSRPRWAAAEQWLARDDAALQAEDARAQLVRAWLATFGPATAVDIKWWLGSTLTAVRQALVSIDAVEVDIEGATGYVLPDDLEDEADPEPWCALLPGLDVTTMGWFDRAWYLGDHKAEVFDTNGNAGPTAWCDGRVVGGWRQNAEGTVQVQLVEDLKRSEVRALHKRAAELTDWLDGTVIKPRFPSPLSKVVLS